MENNIDFTEQWLIKESIKTYEKEKETGKKEIITISKLDLLKLVIKVINLNKKGVLK